MGEELAALFVSLVFCLAPFVSNDGRCAYRPLVFTLSDDAKTKLTHSFTVLLYWGIATIATALSP